VFERLLYFVEADLVPACVKAAGCLANCAQGSFFLGVSWGSQTEPDDESALDIVQYHGVPVALRVLQAAGRPEEIRPPLVGLIAHMCKFRMLLSAFDPYWWIIW